MGSVFSSHTLSTKHLDDFYTIDELIEYIGPPNKTIKKRKYKHTYVWEEIIAHVRPNDNSIIDIIQNN